jgi:ribosome-binding factor A
MSKQAPKPESQRQARVAQAIHEEMSSLLIRGELRDPRAKNATVTRVVVTPDLRLATVYLRSLDATLSDDAGREMANAFRGAAAFLRREIAKGVKLRYAPDLRFFWDEELDRVRRVEEILEDLRTERDES